jgi:hypothetical protein
MEYIENISWAARMGQRRETKSSGAKPVRRNTTKRNEAVLSEELLTTTGYDELPHVRWLVVLCGVAQQPVACVLTLSRPS